jgi:2-(1,2-epoxy-1,2-dihydrophenyl)acetyl-CoA isomerase
MTDASTIATGTDDILAAVTDRVAVITLNRPDRRNALSEPMLVGLEGLLEQFESDPAVGAIVLTGAGGAFCAGGDVKEFASAEAEGTGSLPITYDERVHKQRLSQRATAGRLFEMPKPTIAALPGAAAGAGLSLALACDLRIGSTKAVMTTAFASVGFSGDYGGTWFLSHLVGSGKARELYYLSSRLSATEAEGLGLLNKVVGESELDEVTMQIASQLAHGPSIAYRYMKENLNRAVNGELMECMDVEATHHIHCGTTQDHKHAVEAFVQKRAPTFEGR